jgi:hypothetical protein
MMIPTIRPVLLEPPLDVVVAAGLDVLPLSANWVGDPEAST